ncbi:MAG TPA: two-component regulator propeller domain-containing protein, partial [Gemmatimonadaceae bacterium]
MLFIEEIKQTEGNVQRRLPDGGGDEITGFGDGGGRGGDFGEVTENLEAAFGEGLLGELVDGMEEAADAAGFITDGAEGKREEGLLKIAIAIKEHPLVFEIGSFAGLGAYERFADDGPGRGPAFGKILAQGMRVFLTADGPIAIVIDLDAVRTPRERDGEIGGEAKADGGAKALRPGIDRAKRRLGPILGADELAHLAAADEPTGARVGVSVASLVHGLSGMAARSQKPGRYAVCVKGSIHPKVEEEFIWNTRRKAMEDSWFASSNGRKSLSGDGCGLGSQPGSFKILGGYSTLDRRTLLRVKTRAPWRVIRVVACLEALVEIECRRPMMTNCRRLAEAWCGTATWALRLGLVMLAVGGVERCGAEMAADPNDEFAIQTWTTEDGMPQNIVTALLQTKAGYIWAATYNGIAQFDGESFRVFDSTHTAGLTNSRITSLFEDAKGTIWIGHDTSDLTKYAQGKFEPVPIKAAWLGGTISGIASDSAGDVWIVDVRGEAVRVRDSLLVKPLKEMADEPSVLPQLLQDEEHRLLMVRNGYVAELTEKGFTRVNFKSDETRPYYSRIALARKGGLWVLGQGHVKRWANGVWVEDLGAYPWGNSYVMTMMESSSGQLLAGTLESGLFVHDSTLGWMSLARTNGLPQNWVRSLTEDHEHNIWFGTSGGLVVLRPRSVVMRNPPDQWQGHPVQAITQARDGAVWAATEGGGLYRMKTNGWTNFGASAGLSNPFVWSVMEDSEDRIWAGTWGGGLFRWEGTNFVIKFDMVERGEAVTSLMESPKGTLWIGTSAGLIQCVGDNIKRFSYLGGAAAGDVRALEAGRD